MRIGKFEFTDAGRFEKVSRRLSVNSAYINSVLDFFFVVVVCVVWWGGGAYCSFVRDVGCGSWWIISSLCVEVKLSSSILRT